MPVQGQNPRNASTITAVVQKIPSSLYQRIDHNSNILGIIRWLYIKVDYVIGIHVSECPELGLEIRSNVDDGQLPKVFLYSQAVPVLPQSVIAQQKQKLTQKSTCLKYGSTGTTWSW